MSLQQIAPEKTPGKMQPISTTPTKNTQIPSVPRMTTGSMKSVNNTFSFSENTSPVSFNKNSVRYDQIMDTLLNAGYTIEYRLYDGQTLTHLLARTVLGDRVVIKVVSPQYRATFPKLHSQSADIEMEHRSSTILIPQNIKMGALRCLNDDICGAAFICNGNVCTTERPSQNNKYEIVKRSEPQDFVEHQFVFKRPESIESDVGTVANLGKSIVAYPIVELSNLLQNPQVYIDRIANINLDIAENTFKLLDQDNHKLLGEIQKVENDISALGNMLNDVINQLNGEIASLTQTYQKLNPNQLPDQTEYYLVLKTLSQKKDIRRRLLNAVSNSYDSTQPIKSIPQYFREYVNPVLAEYEKS